MFNTRGEIISIKNTLLILSVLAILIFMTCAVGAADETDIIQSDNSQNISCDSLSEDEKTINNIAGGDHLTSELNDSGSFDKTNETDHDLVKPKATLTSLTYSDSQSEGYNASENSSSSVISQSVSKIKASDFTGYAGIKNSYSVVLSADGAALSEKIVTFKINGKTLTAKTDSKGTAEIDISEAKGTYTLSYSYDGDENITSVSGTSKITIKKGVPTRISKANSVIFRNKKANYFKIKLKDVNGNPLKNKKVTFKIKNKKYVKKTSSKGIATIKIKLKTGSYKIKVTFSKNSVYNKASKTFKIKVKPKHPGNNGMWLFGRDMKSVNLNKLQKYGFKHVFLNFKAIELYGKSQVEKWVKDAKSHGIKVHLWMQVFYGGGKWQNPVKKGKINSKLINSKVSEAKKYAKIKGISGVHFDYVRYPGNAYQYKNSIKAVNTFVKKATKAVHKTDKKLIVSAAVMPEPSSMKKYYAQDIATMGKYLDVIVPMVYKGNYHAGTKWIKSVTKTFKKQSKKAKIWTGLQSYKSDESLKKLSAKELMGDADAAALGGASGVMLFRFGLFNYIDFKKV